MITVIKLGGSLLTGEDLPACLEKAERFPGRVLIVPGGGAFADQVRAAQRVWAFDDRTAHRMAILAMQQMALLFHSLRPDFAVCTHVPSHDGLDKVAIWSPDPNELDKGGVEASWNITSDSLAAWLARQAKAAELVLVKSCPLRDTISFEELQAQGIVDAGFLQFTSNADYKITVIDKARYLTLHD
ncbi:MAG: amino acid kinase family protein [Gammaproteobacteria bacterium]